MAQLRPKNIRLSLGLRTNHAIKLNFQGLPQLNQDFKFLTQKNLENKIRMNLTNLGHNCANDGFRFPNQPLRNDRSSSKDIQNTDILINLTGIGYSYPIKSYRVVLD